MVVAGLANTGVTNKKRGQKTKRGQFLAANTEHSVVTWPKGDIKTGGTNIRDQHRKQHTPPRKQSLRIISHAK